MGRGRPSEYGKAPVVVVWKASKHGRSKAKLKVFRNTNVDEVISGKKLWGIPDDAIFLEVGHGESFIERYKKKYKLK